MARAALRFPTVAPANLLRGALGAKLWRSSRNEYQRIFAPAAMPGSGPSGFGDLPRPFVFRARHLGGITVTPGENFFFDLNVFDTVQSGLIATLLRAFEQLQFASERGGHARAELVSAELLGIEGESLLQIVTGREQLEPLALPLEPPGGVVPGVRVRFLTPTEWKEHGEVSTLPTFRGLACRSRDRISSLMALYNQAPFDKDFRGFAERAAKVEMTHCEIEHIAAKRRSGRTGQTHPLGGFTGMAEYSGELSEFLPFLCAAQWTGVGRQTVWGQGEIRVQDLGERRRLRP